MALTHDKTSLLNSSPSCPERLSSGSRFSRACHPVFFNDDDEPPDEWCVLKVSQFPVVDIRWYPFSIEDAVHAFKDIVKNLLQVISVSDVATLQEKK